MRSHLWAQNRNQSSPATWAATNGGAHRDSTGVHTTYNLQPGLSTGDIHALYQAGIAEAARVLRPGGHLLVKSQDGIESGRRHWTTRLIAGWAECAGFEQVDQGVLVNDKLPRMRHPYQEHARSNHSFLTTFRYHGNKPRPVRPVPAQQQALAL